MENEHGTRPATPASPANSANDKDRPVQSNASVPPSNFAPPENATRLGSDEGGFEPADDCAGGEAEIEAMFRVRLMDLRRLPPSERAAALRAAREWREGARRALRDRRSGARLAQYALWRSRRQPPRAPG